MTRHDPALYDGLLAEAYDGYLAFENFADAAPFRNLIRNAAGPALEIACGTGRLLLPYLAEGLAVEGLDNSRDMLAACRRKAEAAGLVPTLHCADMMDFALQARYGLIYCAAASFTLLAEPGSMERALAMVRRHLLPAGCVAISMDVPPSPDADGLWRLVREAVGPSDGALWRCWMTAEPPRWPGTRRFRMRNEEVSPCGDILRSEERAIDFRPMEADRFSHLLARSGFDVVAIVDANGGSSSNSDMGYIAVARITTATEE